MTKVDAMKILNMTIFTQEILKKAYVKASFKYHPDRNPAGLEMMKAVNAAYAVLKNLPDDDKHTDGTAGEDYGETLNAALNAVIHMEGVNIEICGNWVWLSGNTKPHKDAIKAAGYFWASKKMMWYFRPAEWKSKARGAWDMDKIRETHGSSAVQNRSRDKIEAA